MIKYKEMAEDLNSFDYYNETNLGILPKSQRSISSGARSIPGKEPKKTIFTDDYTVTNY